MTKDGITIRLRVSSICIIGRNTQGVRLVKLGQGDKVAALASVISVIKEENEEEVQDAGETKVLQEEE